MSGRYQFSIDPAHCLLRITFAGFFSVNDLAGYAAAKGAALADLGCRANDHVTLCDFSDCIPQSQDVLALFGRSLDDPVSRSRRLAVVVSGALGQFQAMRIVTRSNAAFFKTVAAAERWLTDSSDAVDPLSLEAIPVMHCLPSAPRRGRREQG